MKRLVIALGLLLSNCTAAAPAVAAEVSHGW